MNRELLAEELDRQIEGFHRANSVEAIGLESLLGVANDLRLLPTVQFKERLRSDLLAQAEEINNKKYVDALPPTNLPLSTPDFLARLEQREFSMLPADPRSFLFSFLSHAAVVALIASGIWIGDVS